MDQVGEQLIGSWEERSRLPPDPSGNLGMMLVSANPAPMDHSCSPPFWGHVVGTPRAPKAFMSLSHTDVPQSKPL